MVSVVQEIHASITPASAQTPQASAGPPEIADLPISFPVRAASSALFWDAVSPYPEPFSRLVGMLWEVCDAMFTGFYLFTTLFSQCPSKFFFMVSMVRGRAPGWAETFFIFLPLENEPVRLITSGKHWKAITFYTFTSFDTPHLFNFPQLEM